jgi:hypothetical protein
MPSEYVLRGGAFSPLTRILDAAPEFYHLPFRQESIGIGSDSQVAKRAGTHQITALETPERIHS